MIYAQALMSGYSLLINELSVTVRSVLLIIASANQLSSPTVFTPSHSNVLSHPSSTSQMEEGATFGGGGGEYDFTL
jgi:hypothetical protein